MQKRLALASVAAARDLDEDLAPLDAALRDAGIQTHTVDWDDADADWSRFDAVLLRSTWDYTERLPEFLAWCERVSAVSTLLNPLDVVRWNTDKHYLRDLAARGIATVESHFVEPGDAPDAFPAFPEFVVKPVVGAGSRDTQRYVHGQRENAVAHVRRLIEAGRSALVQPYLSDVDSAGETALVYFDGVYSHAIRKSPLLRLGEDPTSALFAPEEITARSPSTEERALADRIIASLPFGPLSYARVDLLPSPSGPKLLELELTEPSLFFHTAEGAAARLADVVAYRFQREK
ncbi:hypothetical protein OS187_07465 [Xanthomonadaceae bacterium JHOS43]|nr:hypothetical protein [Xanthomonadaceae bacterium JHOS43]MCX7562855.1 hypothetical protein [Xanthomonadaceae bacterium XH05]